MTKQNNRMKTANHGQLLTKHTRPTWLVNGRSQSTPTCREYIGDAC
jgi:hypothetical protein